MRQNQNNQEFYAENEIEEVYNVYKNTITIPLDEYKDLLTTKGKYEELKNNSKLYNQPLYREFDLNNITCSKGKHILNG